MLGTMTKRPTRWSWPREVEKTRMTMQLKRKKHAKKRNKYLPMKKTLTNVENEAHKDDPSWKMSRENPMCVCVYLFLKWN